MEIPHKATVLVIGGGPGGSYTASALAREGIDIVLLEADVFPRYHIGESLVASMRPFLRFIDLDETFVNYGFVRKNGAAFKLNNQKEAYTDFILQPGADTFAWNVVRSECDDLMFKHASNSGARAFDGVKVTAIEFDPLDESAIDDHPGRPVSASWKAKDGRTGSISFDYLVDASGRAGIASTKYLKSRTYNSYLKNVASWGYWRGATPYGVGTSVEGQPYFEALQDGSGWVWFIPLHNGTTSVGVVMNQELATQKKKSSTVTSSRAFYLESVEGARVISQLLQPANLDGEIKQASDWSYNASSYGSPYLRIVGDAGAFIDPYFSSGVHLAVSGGLSAAVSIAASIRGDCPEHTAWQWHSQGVANRYGRFLLVVLGATKQIRARDSPVLNSEGQDGFDDAFAVIRPVIQGTADVQGKVSAREVLDAVTFSTNAVRPSAGGQNVVLEESSRSLRSQVEQEMGDVANSLAKAYKDTDVYEGLMARLERGSLGLKAVGVMG
ncbi:NAD(P)/FAD-dependent oxidoreductase [Aspergillus niger CBS 101883]|uniref:Halogenase n=2 Tax=Aspergillus niger TaxID=5061 RepID=A0A2I7UGG7_ASPNG|nr:radH flavin-dependent halogenase [Aspergillus niger CBS 513.88]XP_025449778.1 radH flavin-dependent halogenase [Aspergillus niger CBS 101883]AUS29486.1 halogenase [Aspergillus niger]PYH51723.1 radH flavin-dependent halogenase [Aspergillus niger CBS 101883]RDH22082.1 radH flavin-dependent halogenase [Aspergillus niger ATCC 13496]|eukprot:XP_001397309.2 radH flavin-dependent halogenase [Aspergillus niger CBS 513.88]